MIVKAQEGHQGVPLGMAEIATALYTRHLKFNPQDAGWFDRDRVVPSNGTAPCCCTRCCT